MSAIDQPRVYILAGPNGAGKTTFAREFLTHEAACPTFINAHLIADGLYKPIVNAWTLFDCSDALPTVMDRGENP